MMTPDVRNPNLQHFHEHLLTSLWTTPKIDKEIVDLK